MKFDIDIVKSLLEFIEESDCYPEPIVHCSDKSQIELLSDVSRRVISYHLERLIEAGLIDAKKRQNKGRAFFFIYGLTIEGHSFLANAKCDGVWKKIKDKLESVKSFSLDIIKPLLIEYAKSVVFGT